jgi:NTE family protein
MLLQTFAIMGKSINRLELRDADLVLRPALAGMAGRTSARATARLRPAAQRAQQQLPALRQRIADADTLNRATQKKRPGVATGP